MVEKKILSIEITSCCILDKTRDRTLLIMHNRDSDQYKTVDSKPLVEFKQGDYLFMSRMVGEGFVQINYIKMDEKERKKYFPNKKPKDHFSKFAGTSFFKPLE